MAAPEEPDTQQQDEGGPEQPFMDHLIELRARLMRALAVVAVVFLAMMPFANALFTTIARPLLDKLPDNSSMIAIEVASPFLTPFKLVLVLALFVSMPAVLYQLWAFVAPGLYRHERRLATPLLFSASALFYIGAAFAYFVVFPLVFGFFTSQAPEGVSVMTDIARYLDFVLLLLFAFGIAFEVPVAIIVLTAMGVTTPSALASKRPYVIVAAFTVGMLLTPPDVISQTLLALPVWVLFEAGIVAARILTPETSETADESSGDE